MSFKRDGDDKSWLNLLQKRRVAELLSFDIPDDEALLTSNGRFCCLVCSYQPIFDTVSVLATHRSGKKHQLHYEKFAKAKDDLKALKLSRQHEEYIKQGKITSTELLDDETVKKISLGSAPYDPRVKKRKINEQKSRIFLSGENGEYETDDIKVSKLNTTDHIPHATNEESLPGNSKHDYKRSACNNAQERNLTNVTQHKDKVTTGSSFSLKSKHNASLNTISDYKKQQAFENRLMAFKLKPYVSKQKHKLETGSMKDVQQTEEYEIEKYENQSRTDDKQYITSFNQSPIDDKEYITSFVSQEDRKYTNTVSNKDISSINIPTKSTESSTNPPSSTEEISETNEKNTFQSAQNQLKSSLSFPLSGPDRAKKQKKSNGNAMVKSTLSECQMKKAQSYLKAVGSGWKKDFRTGTWVKDEDAEFDSDDEPPDID